MHPERLTSFAYAMLPGDALGESAKLHRCLLADVYGRLDFVYGGNMRQAHAAFHKLCCWSNREGVGGWAALESVVSGSAFQIRMFVAGLDHSGGDVLQPFPHSRQPASHPREGCFAFMVLRQHQTRHQHRMTALSV